MKKRIIVGITGASGSIILPHFLKILRQAGVETHAIISDAGKIVIEHETGSGPEKLEHISFWHDLNNMAAPMSSGSSRFDAMVILPCSMGTLASVAHGYSKNLIHRAADVTLKERRPLLLAIRETPLSRIHIENMLKAHDAGATICPIMPSFYHNFDTVDAMAFSFATRLADLLGIEAADAVRWEGMLK